METELRASLARRPRGAARRPEPLLAPGGAQVILGARATLPAAPIVPSPTTLFGPRGACLSPAGALFACDTGHHRLLAWSSRPTADNAPADMIIGQRDFETEGRNGRGDVGAATLNVPSGIAVEGEVLAVADAWNHRVLLWLGLPARSNQPADLVLGQPDFRSGRVNRGRTGAGMDTLNWPYGVAICDGALYVADTGNRRVLGWESIPRSNGTPADAILDHDLRWPHGISAMRDRVYVADAGAQCVLAWETPFGGGAARARRLAQANMPYGVAVSANRLLVADTADSRLLGFPPEGGEADRLAGQATFEDRGDNRWALPERDSLCWPYGITARGTTAVVADTGNNRILLWELA